MGNWFPILYDSVMAPFEKYRFRKIRENLVTRSQGRVLEIGSGTGVNFPLYNGVLQVDAIEPNPLMRKQSQSKLEQAKVPIYVYGAEAEKLPFENNTFDSVVATLVFCTIPHPAQAIKEIQRVCKPNASLLLFEHIKMHQPVLGKTQEIVTPIWKKICDGCHLNRDTLQLLNQSNMRINKVESYFKGLFIVIEASNKQ
ncbi:class I SAM-dependent methyltransferase [Pseudalkalibacillus hwajinpoensis]|uniref:class I SAM-dependent methyltransferase n=1 Tax=Guptibacillus hwajinpoensis TaxID=208199 RepID=UPI00325AB67B